MLTDLCNIDFSEIAGWLRFSGTGLLTLIPIPVIAHNAVPCFSVSTIHPASFLLLYIISFGNFIKVLILYCFFSVCRSCFAINEVTDAMLLYENFEFGAIIIENHNPPEGERHLRLNLPYPVFCCLAIITKGYRGVNLLPDNLLMIFFDMVCVESTILNFSITRLFIKILYCLSVLISG